MFYSFTLTVYKVFSNLFLPHLHLPLLLFLLLHPLHLLDLFLQSLDLPALFHLEELLPNPDEDLDFELKLILKPVFTDGGGFF